MRMRRWCQGRTMMILAKAPPLSMVMWWWWWWVKSFPSSAMREGGMPTLYWRLTDFRNADGCHERHCIKRPLKETHSHQRWQYDCRAIGHIMQGQSSSDGKSSSNLIPLMPINTSRSFAIITISRCSFAIHYLPPSCPGKSSHSTV